MSVAHSGDGHARGRDRRWGRAAWEMAFGILHLSKLPAELRCPREGLDPQGLSLFAFV